MLTPGLSLPLLFSTHVHGYVYLGSHAQPQTFFFCPDSPVLLFVSFFFVVVVVVVVFLLVILQLIICFPE